MLPKPQRLHHVVEDFLTDWSRDTAHVLPLRRYLESCVGRSLRNYYHDDCFQMQLLHRRMPVMCGSYLQGGGLKREFSVSSFTVPGVMS